MVVIEKDGLGRIGGQVEPVFRRTLGEGPIAVIDKKFVVALEPVFTLNGANIDIQEPVAIDVRHGHACTPIGGTTNSGFVGDVFKLKISLIDKKLVSAFVVG